MAVTAKRPFVVSLMGYLSKYSKIRYLVRYEYTSDFVNYTYPDQFSQPFY